MARRYSDPEAEVRDISIDFTNLTHDHPFFTVLLAFADQCENSALAGLSVEPKVCSNCPGRYAVKEAAFYREAAKRIRALVLSMSSLENVPESARTAGAVVRQGCETCPARTGLDRK